MSAISLSCERGSEHQGRHRGNNEAIIAGGPAFLIRLRLAYEEGRQHSRYCLQSLGLPLMLRSNFTVYIHCRHHWSDGKLWRGKPRMRACNACGQPMHEFMRQMCSAVAIHPGAWHHYRIQIADLVLARHFCQSHLHCPETPCCSPCTLHCVDCTSC